MGGIGQLSLHLANALNRIDHHHSFTALVSDAVDGLEMPFFVVGAGMIDPSFEQFRLPQILKDLKTDLYLNTCFSVPLLKTSKYQMSIIHDVVFEDRPEWVEPKLRDYLSHWSRIAATFADRIITVSDYSKGRISKVYGIEPDRIIRIYNGVAPPPRLSEEFIEHVRKKYTLEKSFVLYIGTIERKKGLPELINAVAHLSGSDFNDTLVFAGARGGGEWEIEQELAQKKLLSRSKLLGHVPELEKWALLKLCSVLIYPSKYEGFGLTPLEAMSIGTPCITNNTTSLPEIVGSAAIKVDVTQVKAFSEAILRALRNQDVRRVASEMGPTQARHFTWEKSAAQYIAQFEAVVS
ncbi:MAG TPA: glycosyltransferase family 1 protein [Candidatus Paceibacterota bacterium]|nr:glycosyltransferase family 1 protein [Candidatus Paceibacterota bacterium]